MTESVEDTGVVWLFIVPCKLEAIIEAELCIEASFVWVVKSAGEVDAI